MRDSDSDSTGGDGGGRARWRAKRWLSKGGKSSVVPGSGQGLSPAAAGPGQHLQALEGLAAALSSFTAGSECWQRRAGGHAPLVSHKVAAAIGQAGDSYQLYWTESCCIVNTNKSSLYVVEDHILSHSAFYKPRLVGLTPFATMMSACTLQRLSEQFNFAITCRNTLVTSRWSTSGHPSGLH